MKVYISHDVDHLSVSEHVFRDISIPKYIIISTMELLKGLIGIKTYLRKIGGLCKRGTWNRIEALAHYNKENGVAATFFIATGRGKKGLVYPLKKAVKAIKTVDKYKQTLGVHGVEDKDKKIILKEYKRMKDILGHEQFGVRMHYLRINARLCRTFKEMGYSFDASVYDPMRAKPFYINRLKTYPINIMDTYYFSPLKQSLTLKEAIQKTKETFKSFEKQGEIHILLHQRHFDKKQFPQYYHWYTWLINYCKEKKYKFVAYR